MPLQKFQLRPGIIKDMTSYANEGGWTESQWVRFRLGYPESMGGWEYELEEQFIGECVALHHWTTNSGLELIAIATTVKLYLYYADSIVPSLRLVDITPWAGPAVSLVTDPFTTNNPLGPSAQYLNVSYSGGDIAAGQYVTFTGATAFDAYTPSNLNNHSFRVVSSTISLLVVDIGVTSLVNGVVGGGAAVTIRAEIDGPPVGDVLWSLDNFGEDLVAGLNGGNIYYCDTGFAWGSIDRAVPLSDLPGSVSAPTVCTGIVVSEIDRHLIVFGANPLGSSTQDPLLVRWSDQEDVLDWAPSTDNTTGEYRISTGSIIKAWTRARQETVIWTDAALHSMQFMGPPYTFGFNLIAEGNSAISQNCYTEANNTIFWMDQNAFKYYDGSVNTIPCPLQDYVFDNLLQSYASRICCGTNTRFNEIWWFYRDTLLGYRYIVYNFIDRIWCNGVLRRSAWLEVESNGHPYATNDGYLYTQEVGTNDADGVAIGSSVTGGSIDIGDGESFTFLRGIIPDFTGRGATPTGSLQHTVGYRNFTGQSYSNGGTQSGPSTTAEFYFRARGRQFQFTFAAATVGFGWRLGTPLIDIQPDGKKV